MSFNRVDPGKNLISSDEMSVRTTVSNKIFSHQLQPEVITVGFSVRAIFQVLEDPLNLKIYTLLLQDELCDRELADLLGQPIETIHEHLDILMNLELIGYEVFDNCKLYQARSNPFEEAREKVIEGESHEWNNLHRKICEVKQKKLCSYRKNPSTFARESEVGV